MYYLGKGTELEKEGCKEYKTIEGALKAAAKDESLVIWDETGKVIGSLAGSVPEGALQENTDGSVSTYDADGNKTGTMSAGQVAAVVRGEDEKKDSENGAAREEISDSNTEKEKPEVVVPQDGTVAIPQGRMRVTVICNGSLNMRRSPSWGNDNICGRAVKGQQYYVKEVLMVDGKKMVRTLGGIYLSGEPEHVRIEQL